MQAAHSSLYVHLAEGHGPARSAIPDRLAGIPRLGTRTAHQQDEGCNAGQRAKHREAFRKDHLGSLIAACAAGILSLAPGGANANQGAGVSEAARCHGVLIASHASASDAAIFFASPVLAA